VFTGLVEEVGVVRRLDRCGSGGRLVVGAQKVLEGTKLGDSIAVSGACLTVIDLGRDELAMDCMSETLSRTTLGRAEPGMRVNLERSLAVGGRLGGHFVLGHVDAVGEVLGVVRRGISWEVRFSLPETLSPYAAEKGSVAIDGVSLTVMRVGHKWFDVGIIPHTLKETTLGAVETGVHVNLEADVIARYVQRSLQSQGDGGGHTRARQGLTEDLLREKGFI
jgi:riboflavin synthase